MSYLNCIPTCIMNINDLFVLCQIQAAYYFALTSKKVYFKHSTCLYKRPINGLVACESIYAA